jgi:hypothetical protein
MGDREHETTEHADAHFDARSPSRVPPERGGCEHGDTERAEYDDPDVPMRVQTEPKTGDARRHDEPQHEAVKMRFRSKRDRRQRQECDENGNREAVHDANARQGDRDSVEEMSRQDH